ncbi:MAG TPA: hypothetical protein VLD63_10260, partial [Anaerolineales bacterium]|nr:hypothetical protein [Anaerolineales bacterium]
MADEAAESVGGISVSASIDDSKVDAELNALLNHLRSVAERAQIGIPVSVQQGAAPTTTARPPAQQAAPRMVFGPGAGTAAQAAQSQTALQRAIAVELAKTGERYDETTGRIEKLGRAARAQQQSVAQIAAVPIQSSEIEPTLDEAKVKALFGAMLRSLQAVADEQAPTITPKVARAQRGTRVPRAAVADDRALQELSYEAQRQGGAAAPITGFAPLRTPTQIAAYRAEQQRRSDEMARVAAAAPPRLPARPARPANFGPSEPYLLPDERGVGGRAGRGRTRTEEDVLRSQEERLARAEAQAVSAGRTSRTQASALGGFLGGRRELIKAETDLAAASEKVRIAQRRLDDPAIIGNRRAFRHATEELTVAENERAAALQKVESFTSFTAGARNLLAVTAAGAAFGLGLKVVDTALTAVTTAAGNYFEIVTGFGGTSTRITAALGQQTIALHGNAEAALLAAEAQAGLSEASADALNQQLRVTTQIKAGAIAQQQASELFRAGAGVGNAPTGLYGGYGGVLGTAFLAQQLGGGRGFTETVQQDLSAFGKPQGGPDILGDFNRGMSYFTNGEFRQTIDDLARQQNQQTPLDQLQNLLGGFGGPLNIFKTEPQAPTTPFQQPLTQEAQDYLNNLNDAARRAAPILDATATAQYRQARSAEELATGIRAAAQAGDTYGVTLAQQQGIVVALGDAVADSGEKYRRATEQFAVGVGIADPATLGRLALAQERQRQLESRASLDAIRARQAFDRPGIIAGIGRQAEFARRTQIPAQAGLTGITQPLAPVGTGIVAANAEEQTRISAGQKLSIDLQAKLNANYEQGRRVLETTYRTAIVRNFGEAQGRAFDQALASLRQVSAQIVDIQANLSNEQAAYQTAQFNYQLQIAKRTLSDIEGLTGRDFRSD